MSATRGEVSMHRWSLVFVFVSVACAAKSGGPPPSGPLSSDPPPSVAGTPPPSGPTAPPPGDPCPQEVGGKDAPDGLDGAPALTAGTHQGCYGVNDKKDTFTIAAPAHKGPVA